MSDSDHDELPTVEVLSGNPIKFLVDPTDYLLRSGLLFEINRRVLHPFGLAMSLEVDEETDKPTKYFNVKLWDSTEDPEGIIFTDEMFESGRTKFQTFKDVHKKRLATRLIALGYLIQGGE